MQWLGQCCCAFTGIRSRAVCARYRVLTCCSSALQNPLCCNNQNGYKFGGTMTSGNGTDVLLVSGAYKVITLTVANGTMIACTAFQ
jgi:hypothetical protein